MPSHSAACAIRDGRVARGRKNILDEAAGFKGRAEYGCKRCHIAITAVAVGE
jgi:hypothetical protein